MNRRLFVHRRSAVSSACAFTNRSIASSLSAFVAPGSLIAMPEQGKNFGAGHDLSALMASNKGEIGVFSGENRSEDDCRESRDWLRDWFLSYSVNPRLKEVEFYEHMKYFKGILVQLSTLDHRSKILAVLSYQQCTVALDQDDGLSFSEWLQVFQPLDRHDCAMALDLYFSSLDFGETIPTIQPTQDLWLNAFLKDTRGFLLWRHKFIELVRIVAAYSGNKLAMTPEDILMALNKKETSSVMVAEDILDKIRYPDTGQTLLEIVYERSHRRRYWGAPDYITADWLLRYLSEEWVNDHTERAHNFCSSKE